MKKNRLVSVLTLLGVFIGVASSVLAEPLSFSSATLATGGGPISVVATNINGVGAPDLVSANFGFRYGCTGDGGATGSNLTVWINNGHGVFSSHSSIEVGSPSLAPEFQPEPSCVTAADLYGNGKLELIYAAFDYNLLNIMTNNGHGGFTTEHVLTPGRGPVYFTIADVNGDGRPDVITVNNFDSTVSVLTNAGNGTFDTNLAACTYAVGSGPCYVAAADLNGDGSVDLVCANYGDCGDGNTLTVLTNNGHGLFTLSATLTVGYAPTCVIAADVNGDGKIDIISANQADSTLTVLTNDGHGNFTLKATVGVFSPSCVVATDINGDGKTDLVCADSNNGFRGSVTVLTNDGRGNFSTNTIVPVGPAADVNYPDNLIAADLSGNGKIDLVVANYGSASLTVLTQTSGTQRVSPTPVVSLTSPTNGEAFLTTQSIAVKAATRSAVNEVELYVDGQLLEGTAVKPYSFQIAAGSLASGEHTLQVVAVASGGASGSSALAYITVNAPGTSLIDFDALDTSAGAVGGTLLTQYLASYGVTLEDVTVGAAMEAVNTNSLTGTIQAEVPSAPNFFTEAGLNQPVSFTLRFATPLQSFAFTNVGLSSQSGWVSEPQWTATAFNASGTELSSVTEALVFSPVSVPAQSFILPGNGIASVRFDSDSQQIAAFSGVLLDNLVLSTLPVAPTLSVALSVASPPTNNIVAPATITLDATVTDTLSSSYYVSFFAGPSLLGTVSNSPFAFTWTNVLPGNYSLQARVVDSSGLAVQSQVVPITVQLEPDSLLVDFDALNTSRAPVEGAALKKYLAGFGVTIASLSPGTELTVENQQHIAGGAAVLAASPPNLLTQTGSSGPVQFTLAFAPLLSQFGFTRPELLANPFVSQPAWQVTAFDGSGAVVEQVGEAEIDSSTNVGAQEFSLSGGAGPGIAKVEFSSEGSGLTTFNGMLADNFVLTTNKSGFPPAVTITQPVSGQVLAAPPAVTVTASASDAAGIATVSFYAQSNFVATAVVTNFFLGTATASPYSITWTNPPIGNFALTAVASNKVGLTWTSAIVNIVIGPSADQFGILTQPASQTVSAGASVTFAVVTTGTNAVTYQWSHNADAISGATSRTLVLPPPIQDSDAGNYTVTATADGTNLVSDPAVLTVVDPPAFNTQPQGQTVAAGANVTLTVGVAGGGPFTWQWLLNGTRIPGATNDAFSIRAAQPLNSGNYQVVVANLAASTNSAIAPVIVETPVTIPESNDSFADRATINPLLGSVSDSNLLAKVQAGAPLPDGLPGGNSIWFTWQPAFTGTVSLTTLGSDFDTVLAIYTGTELPKLKAVAADDDSGGFLTSLVTFNVTAGTDYQIAVDGFQGASGRVVLGLPTGTGYRILSPSSGDSVPVIARGPASQVVAPNARAVLSVQASSKTKMTFQWHFQGAPIAGATGSTLVIGHVQPGSVGFYDVLVANSAGSVQSEPASLQIAVSQGGTAPATENKLLNTGDSDSPAELAYHITPLDLGGDTRGFSLSQTFSTVGATREPGEPDPCGQIGGASQWFVLTAPVSGIMEINTDGSTFNTLLGVYTGSGASFADLTEVGCGYSTNYVTEGQPSVLLPSVAKGTLYFIQVDGYKGASGVAQLQIGLGKPLSFQSLPSSQLVTAGSNVTFNATAVGSTPAFYQWQLNGANLPGATKSILSVTHAKAESEGNYTVVASNSLGAVTSSPPAALRVQFAPDIVAGPSNETVTLGHSARFIVEALGVNVKTNPFVCQWYFNGAPLPKTDRLSLSIPVTRATNAGAYYLVITNTYGSVTSAPAMLIVLDSTSSQIVNKTAANNFYKPPSSSPAGQESAQSAATALSAAAGTYSGLFYPSNGATEASSGFFTATVASRGAGAFSASLLLDGGRYSFAGQFDSSGNAQSIVPRAGQSSVTTSLHLDLDATGGPITGVISNAEWRSLLQAGLAVFDAVTNPAPVCAGQFALVIPSGANTPVGYLTITSTPGGTALVTGALADRAGIVRTAPMVKGAAIPLYVPLYSGKGLFLGWITLTNSPAGTNFGAATWIKPGSPTAATVLIVK